MFKVYNHGVCTFQTNEIKLAYWWRDMFGGSIQASCGSGKDKVEYCKAGYKAPAYSIHLNEANHKMEYCNI